MRDFDQFLDTSGLNCPLPLLKLKKALVAMASGDVIQVLSTDPASVLDFGVFSDQTGNEILEKYDKHGTLHYFIRKT